MTLSGKRVSRRRPVAHFLIGKRTQQVAGVKGGSVPKKDL